MIKEIGEKCGWQIERESKIINKCNKCKNGPMPHWYCGGCQDFYEACAAFDLNVDEIKASHKDKNVFVKYTDAQKDAVNDHLQFLNKLVNGWMNNDITINDANETFAKTILNEILRIVKTEQK